MKAEYCGLIPCITTLWLVFCVGLCSITNSLAASSNSRQRQCHFPAIFNFGDSNSDKGGLSAAFGQAGPPSGETFFHHPAGRYSDYLHYLLSLHSVFVFLRCRRPTYRRKKTGTMAKFV